MLWAVFSLLSVLLKYVLILLIAAYCWFRWSHRRLLAAAAKLPYLFPAYPIVGHAYFSFRGRDGLANMILKMTNLAVAKGLKIMVVWCGPLPMVTVFGKDDVKTILNNSNTIDKGNEYEFFKFGLDSGGVETFKYSLLTASGQLWRVIRKHMQPMFHPHNLQHMVPVMNRNSREFVSCLSGHVGLCPVNLMPHTMDTALKTVCNLLFGPGVEIDIKSEEFRGLITLVETIPELFITRLSLPWLRIDSLFQFFYGKQLKELNLFFKNFTEAHLKMARSKSKPKQIISTVTGREAANELPYLEDAQDNGSLNVVDAFGTLQKNHPEFSEADLWYETFTFYCTGSDTVGSTVASCLLALAQYQDIQERLYGEICSAVGPGNDDVTPQDLNRMPYLDQVLKETLRWFVIVPFILRRAAKDTTLGTCTIPAGNTIVVSLQGISRDPEFYKDPNKFDPEHFSPERMADIDRFYFIPFSGGPRDCIAKVYAMQLMKTMVVHTLRKYKLSTAMDISKLNKKLMITLVNADGYNISLQERNTL